MTINYGKRNPGGLTAASPGDTLYIPFAAYNDSGASIGIGGTLAVSDIEIMKNGNATPRATDSGYSLISDTGQYGNRVGLHRFSISLFNTADDTGFFDVGSQYHVIVDSITVDGRTVRFIPAVFEIGTPRANVIQVDGDTGFADRLGKFASLLSATGTIQANTLATDAITAAKIAADAATEIATAVWSTAGRKLAVDTGIAEQVWKSSASSFTDTGSLGFGVNVQKLAGDTGDAVQLGKFASALSADGQIDTGTGAADTGVLSNSVWNSLKASHGDTGSFGEELAGGVNVAKIVGDTGAARHLAQLADEYDTGSLPTDAVVTLDTGSIVTAVVDTGQINRAVWQGDATRVLTANTNLAGLTVDVQQLDGDTGAANRLSKFAGIKLTDSGTLDTGTGATGGGSASIDTGQINQAVWQGDASRTLTAWAFDTGVQQKLDRYDTGVRSAIVQLSSKADTGVPASIWAAGTRTLTGFAFDTGIQQKLDRLDTGMSETIDAIKTQTDKLTFDTGANELHADIRKVANVQITGTGDTGTGDTWRPA
jgi:hypothetical protein